MTDEALPHHRPRAGQHLEQIRVQAGGGLVDDDQRRLADQRLGDAEALAGGPPIEALVVYNSNPVAVAPESPKVVRGFALVGAGYALWTLWGAGIEASGWSLVLMAAGAPLYWWARRGGAA